MNRIDLVLIMLGILMAITQITSCIEKCYIIKYTCFCECCDETEEEEEC